MNEMKIWLKKHGACTAGYAWSVENCDNMQDVWNTAKPEWLIWVATRQGIMSDAQCRKFACWCARQVWHLLKDKRSKKAVEVSERFADGLATNEELASASAAAMASAWSAAWDAASGSASAAARAAAWAAALDAASGSAWAAARASAWDAAWDAASGSAWAAALDAASGSAWDAASAAARVSAWSAQAKWIRENVTPNFKESE